MSTSHIVIGLLIALFVLLGCGSCDSEMTDPAHPGFTLHTFRSSGGTTSHSCTSGGPASARHNLRWEENGVRRNVWIEPRFPSDDMKRELDGFLVAGDGVRFAVRMVSTSNWTLVYVVRTPDRTLPVLMRGGTSQPNWAEVPTLEALGADIAERGDDALPGFRSRAAGELSEDAKAILTATGHDWTKVDAAQWE